ncbi:AraC family transcriptional regulator [Chitinibacteraceae bacterium HSL-7]
MHAHLSKTDAKDVPDTLTALLLGMRLEGIEYERSRLDPPWALAFDAEPNARFHFVAQGQCWIRSDQGEWMALQQGDAVLLPRGEAHVLASSPDVAPIAHAQAQRQAVAGNLFSVRCGNGTPCPEPSVLFGGAMRFNLDPLHPLLTMMPTVVRARDLARRDPAVPALLEAMEREVELDRIGACGILARLADVLAATIIRGWVECACSAPTGWVAALRCPQIGKVLVAIHAEPERDWRVDELARLMGASRSSFADKFTRAVGESPARYVARIKMFEARRWIAREGVRVAVAADRLGYDSEASFSRAFKRIIGHPPSEARARQSR